MTRVGANRYAKQCNVLQPVLVVKITVSGMKRRNTQFVNERALMNWLYSSIHAYRQNSYGTCSMPRKPCTPPAYITALASE